MGESSIKINAYLAATAWNLKKLMKKLKEQFLYFIFRQINFQYCLTIIK